MNKPAYIAVEPEGVAEWMAALDRWVLWKAEFNGTKWTKVPYRTTGRGKASSTDPKTWSNFDDAVEAYTAGLGGYDGIGFVLGDGYAGIDLDHVISENGLDDQAAAVLEMFGGCYCEKSPSGDGYHIVFRTDYNNPDHVRKLEPIEFYTKGRYFTVTGCSLMSETQPAEFVEAATVEFFHDRYLASKASAHIQPAVLPTGHSADVDGATDEELLYVLFEKFPGTWELYNGDTTRYDNDDSRADLALCGALVKVSHGDIARADVLFRNSGLYRPKWDELRGTETYGQITLRKAMNGYDPAKAPRIAAAKPIEERRDELSWVFEDGDLL
ncbi:MAG: hypothetical protein IJ087_19680, partial [Eggerthellaceae bacterium]|nr:hypothetical protein [Eggerthellaceae bacterium]